MAVEERATVATVAVEERAEGVERVELKGVGARVAGVATEEVAVEADVVAAELVVAETEQQIATVRRRRSMPLHNVHLLCEFPTNKLTSLCFEHNFKTYYNARVARDGSDRRRELRRRRRAETDESK